MRCRRGMVFQVDDNMNGLRRQSGRRKQRRDAAWQIGTNITNPKAQSALSPRARDCGKRPSASSRREIGEWDDSRVRGNACRKLSPEIDAGPNPGRTGKPEVNETAPSTWSRSYGRVEHASDVLLRCLRTASLTAGSVGARSLPVGNELQNRRDALPHTWGERL